LNLPDSKEKRGAELPASKQFKTFLENHSNIYTIYSVFLGVKLFPLNHVGRILGPSNMPLQIKPPGDFRIGGSDESG
jgi:hypothetical protein